MSDRAKHAGDTDRFEAIREDIEELAADVDEPGASRHLEDALTSIVGAKRMFEWERRG